MPNLILGTPARMLGFIFALTLLVVGVVFGFHLWRYSQTHEKTDDAYVAGDIIPISAKVNGNVTQLLVSDNQYVHAGDILVQLDPADYQVRVAQAAAALAAAKGEAAASGIETQLQQGVTGNQVGQAGAAISQNQAAVAAAQQSASEAQASITQQQAAVQAAQANLQAQQAGLQEARLNLQRMQTLRAQQFVSQADLDRAIATFNTAQAQAQAAQSQISQAQANVIAATSRYRSALANIAQTRSQVVQSQANLGIAQSRTLEVPAQAARAQANAGQVQQAEANLAAAQLNLAYTTIRAPISGVIGRRTVQIGQVVQPNQPLLAIVPLNNVWVQANFKETQLSNIHTGNPVILTVDALPGRRYKGIVQSITPASGAVFSMLPPENASGNFVKVVQRIPVRIGLLANQNQDMALLPGMSTVVNIRTDIIPFANPVIIRPTRDKTHVRKQ